LRTGSAITGGADEIIAYLDRRYTERTDAQQHRDWAEDHDGK
jgi:hypothetical protein